MVPYDLHRDSVNKRHVCDTAKQYETFGCYSATLWGVQAHANYSTVYWPCSKVSLSLLFQKCLSKGKGKDWKLAILVDFIIIIRNTDF